MFSSFSDSLICSVTEYKGTYKFLMLYPVTSDQYVGLYLKCTRHRLVLIGQESRLEKRTVKLSQGLKTPFSLKQFLLNFFNDCENC